MSNFGSPLDTTSLPIGSGSGHPEASSQPVSESNGPLVVPLHHCIGFPDFYSQLVWNFDSPPAVLSLYVSYCYGPPVMVLVPPIIHISTVSNIQIRTRIPAMV